jgi:HK97 family phage major capsid protein/HK97 family phage prohead protease
MQIKTDDKFFRTMRFKAPKDADSRTVEMSISSEEPVERYFGTEILVHEAGAIRMDFIGGGSAPLLLDHDHRKQIGVIEGVSLDENRKLRATVRFSRSALAEEVFTDIQDGIRSNVSIGYMIERTDTDEKTNVVRVTQWMPFEASIVSVPADTTVGVGRAIEEVKSPAIVATVQRESEMNAQVDEKPAPVATGANTGLIGWTQEQRDAEVKNIRQESAAIMELGRKHGGALVDDALRFVNEGRSLSEFRGHVLDKLPANKPLVSMDIGLTDKETRQFSIIRLAAAVAPNANKAERDAAGFELEATQAAADMASRQGRVTKGSQMPAEVLRNWIPPDMVSMEYAERARREERAVTFAGSGVLVPEDYRPGSFIDVLRNDASVMQSGATMLLGLQGTVEIPKKLTASAATWISAEAGNAANSEPTFGPVAMTPRDLAVYADITRKARQNMVPSIEALVRQDITRAIALGLDLAGIEGTGASGQPTGVRNVVGINKPTAFAGANPTFAEAVALETMVADDNALQGNLAYILRTNMRGALKTAEKFASTGQTIWEPGGTLNGYRGVVSNQITDGNLYFGNWSDLLIGFWSTLDLQFDYAALALSGGLRLIAFQTADVAVRRAESFAWNT